MPTYRMKLEYDGTDFVGWQNQPNGRSVQREVEGALRQIFQDEISIVGGGRTDAGVHATGQVASFRLPRAADTSALLKSLNGMLPDDVVVKSLEATDEDFHARFSARSRKYRYQIALEPLAVGRKYVWQVFWPLAVEQMSICAAHIVGEHDFQSFCKYDTETPHFRCHVRSADWNVAGPLLTFRIESNRFLYGMVRALVGTMVNVGRGYTPVERFSEIMEQRDRQAAGMAAPPQGLILETITYD